MIPAPLDDASPVTTLAEARERVADLLGPAMARILWIMLLDRHGRQLPVLTPIANLAVHPEPNLLSALATHFEALLREAAPGGRLILTLERPGPGVITAHDRSWASEVTRAFDAHAEVIGLFLAHDHGVALLTC